MYRLDGAAAVKKMGEVSALVVLITFLRIQEEWTHFSIFVKCQVYCLAGTQCEPKSLTFKTAECFHIKNFFSRTCVACEILVFPHHGSSLHPLCFKCRVLTTGSPGKSLIFYNDRWLGLPLASNLQIGVEYFNLGGENHLVLLVPVVSWTNYMLILVNENCAYT